MSFNQTVLFRRWNSPGLRLGRHSNSIHRMHLYTRRNLINPNFVSFIFLKHFNNLKISKAKICRGYCKKGNFFSIFSLFFFFKYRVCLSSSLGGVFDKLSLGCLSSSFHNGKPFFYFYLSLLIFSIFSVSSTWLAYRVVCKGCLYPGFSLLIE